MSYLSWHGSVHFKCDFTYLQAIDPCSPLSELSINSSPTALLSQSCHPAESPLYCITILSRQYSQWLFMYILYTMHFSVEECTIHKLGFSGIVHLLFHTIQKRCVEHFKGTYNSVYSQFAFKYLPILSRQSDIVHQATSTNYHMAGTWELFNQHKNWQFHYHNTPYTQ